MLCFSDKMFIFVEIKDHDFGTQRCIVKMDLNPHSHSFRLERFVSGNYFWEERRFGTLLDLFQYTQKARNQWWWYYANEESLLDQGFTVIN